MTKIGFYLMGLKGYECLTSVANFCENNKDFSISFVVGARDKNVVKDYFDEIKAYANNRNINFFEKQSEFKTPESDIDFAISWRWLIKDGLEKLVVFHDSILPQLRGFNPLVTALIEGHQEIGVTALRADKDFDKGNVVGLKKATISYPIKIGKATEIVSSLYSDLILDVVQKAGKNELVEEVQDENNATYSLWRDEDDYLIDWTESSEKIVRTIDALGFPYKGASTTYNGQKIRVLDAVYVQDFAIINRCAGKILSIRDNKPVVVCGNGLVQIELAHDDLEQKKVDFDKLRIRLK